MASVSVKMDDNLKEAIAKYADEHDLSMSWVIRKALQDFLDNNTKKVEE